jgi:large repetitive protein
MRITRCLTLLLVLAASTIGAGAVASPAHAICPPDAPDCNPPDDPPEGDQTPPNTFVTTDDNNDNTAVITGGVITLGFASNESPATFACKLDGGAWSACASPKTYSFVSGNHDIRIRATDAAGNVDPSPVAYHVDYNDGTWPTVLITTPNTGGWLKDNTPTTTFTVSEPGATAECALDDGVDGPWAPCSSPYTTPPLPDGGTSIWIRAIDTSGNVGNPAQRNVLIDTTPATVVFTKAPVTTYDHTPTFEWTVGAPLTFNTYECKVDGILEPVCGTGNNSTWGRETTAWLPAGAHTFSVQATDEAGNQSAWKTHAFEVKNPVLQTATATR